MCDVPEQLVLVFVHITYTAYEEQMLLLYKKSHPICITCISLRVTLPA